MGILEFSLVAFQTVSCVKDVQVCFRTVTSLTELDRVFVFDWTSFDMDHGTNFCCLILTEHDTTQIKSLNFVLKWWHGMLFLQNSHCDISKQARWRTLHWENDEGADCWRHGCWMDHHWHSIQDAIRFEHVIGQTRVYDLLMKRIMYCFKGLENCNAMT